MLYYYLGIGFCDGVEVEVKLRLIAIFSSQSLSFYRWEYLFRVREIAGVSKGLRSYNNFVFHFRKTEMLIDFRTPSRQARRENNMNKHCEILVTCSDRLNVTACKLLVSSWNYTQALHKSVSEVRRETSTDAQTQCTFALWQYAVQTKDAFMFTFLFLVDSRGNRKWKVMTFFVLILVSFAPK